MYVHVPVCDFILKESSKAGEDASSLFLCSLAYQKFIYVSWNHQVYCKIRSKWRVYL